MKFYLLTLGIAASAIALGLTGIAVAAPADKAPAVTYRDIAHENLVREFSQGLGANLAGANPVHHGHERERSHEHRTNKTKHSH